MKYFLKLCEVARRDGVWRDRRDGDEFGLIPLDKIDPFVLMSNDEFGLIPLDKIQPFVLMSNGANLEEYEYLDEDERGALKIESAPFSAFSIENLSGHLSAKSGHLNAHVALKFWCCAFFEISPGCFDGVSLLGEQDPYEGDSLAVTLTDSRNVRKFLAETHTHKIGQESVRIRIKLGRGSDKRIHTIRKVIYVAPKTKKDSIAPSLGRKIDWSHRFFVRGHWRDLGPGKIGKNREGIYCVPEKTWVTECEKGPDDLPPIRKVRVVTSTEAPTPPASV